jgi:MYXO-CTERM domain-containing protein
MRLVVIAVVAIGQTAGADDLVIAIDRDTTIAPSAVTLTASITSGDPILSYQWSGLSQSPRCREKSCSFAVPLASCTAVEVEAFTAFGETLTATSAVCATDENGARAPSLRLTLRNGRAETVIKEGDAGLIFLRSWIDGVEQLEQPESVLLPDTPGCHAVDVLAADEGGRIGIAQKTICSGVDDPQLWIGGQPNNLLPVFESFSICSVSAHPLGLELSRTAGETMLDTCGSMRLAPKSIEHQFVSAVDPRGVTTTGSAFFAAYSAEGPRTLFFAVAPSRLSWTNGRAGSFTLSLYGGVPPYELRGISTTSIEETPDLLRVGLTVTSAVGPHDFPLTITDARGLEAKVMLEVTVNPGSIGPDPGFPADTTAACNHTRTDRESSAWLALLAFAVLLWRRR